MAVGAFDVLKNSPVYATLSDALKDINVAIGTTCGKQRSLSPEGLAALSAELNAHGNNRIAIVFGEERDGLLQKELELCHHIMRIATSSEFPSLNVAQAVGIVAYEISRQRDAAAAKAEDCAKRAEADLAKVDEYESNAEPEFAKAEQYASGAEADELFSRLEVLLHEVGFTRSFNKNSVIAEFRALYMRAKPSQREMRLLEGALRKIEQKIGP